MIQSNYKSLKNQFDRINSNINELKEKISLTSVSKSEENKEIKFEERNKTKSDSKKEENSKSKKYLNEKPSKK